MRARGFLALLLVAADARGAALVIRNARLIDGTGVPPRDGVSILVRDGRIARVASDIAPDDTTVLDVAGATVLPGLMDVHVHFIVAPGGGFRKDSPETLRRLNRRHLRAYLASGVTTVLDAGIDPAVARDIQGDLAAGAPGPRFLTTGPYVRPPNGYGWDGFGAERTPAEVEAKLDLVRSLGAPGIKLAFEPASGFSPEMRRAILDGAARRGLFVFVHAMTEAAQREALDWGARAIMHPVMGGRWHGDFLAPRDLSDEFVARMRASGAYQVTTLSLLDTWPGHFDPALLDDPRLRLVVPAEERATAHDPAALRAFADDVVGWAMPWIPHAVRPLALDSVWTRANLDAGMAYSQRNLRRLHEAGVPLVVGTDAPSPWPYAVFHFHGWQTPREMELVGAAGIPSMDVLVAATRRPAEMLGIAGDVGTVEVGKRADLVVVRGDPLDDLRALRRVAWTIHDGVPHTPAEWMEVGSAERID
jgi:imidazolonepropionase-like amidohydrolase